MREQNKQQDRHYTCNLNLWFVRVKFMSPILTDCYHFTRREQFCGDLMSAAIKYTHVFK